MNLHKYWSDIFNIPRDVVFSLFVFWINDMRMYAINVMKIVYVVNVFFFLRKKTHACSSTRVSENIESDALHLYLFLLDMIIYMTYLSLIYIVYQK